MYILGAYCRRKKNPRVISKEYSTGTTKKVELTTLGVEFYISPHDSFDFVPSVGYSEGFEEIEGLVSSNPTNNEHATITKGGNDEIHGWAKHLRTNDNAQIYQHQIPMPNKSLSGKVLTVTDSKYLFEADEGICHLIEHERYMCHKPRSPVDIIKITVSPHGKPNYLWVACHRPIDKDDHQEWWYHVMNVGDSLPVYLFQNLYDTYHHEDFKTSELMRKLPE